MSDIDFLDLNEELGQERMENDYPWIVFALGKTEYGINSKYVLSIEILGTITPVVEMPYYCPGIVEFRGEMIDLMDLRVLFGMGDDYLSVVSNRHDGRHMMVVLEIGAKKRGVIVDEIVSVEYITDFLEGVSDVKENPAGSGFIQRIAKREKQDSPVLIISPERLIEA